MVRKRWLAVVLIGGAGCAEDGDAGAARDTGVASLIDASTATCEQAQTFLEQHRACSVDSDCAIAGSCSGGFGFRAVQSAVRVEAQALSDRGVCGPVFDGPTFHAVCERGLCTARPTGIWCGGLLLPDGGTAGCPRGMELYQTNCTSDAPTAHSCERRCSGASDTSCGAGQTCSKVRVSEVAGTYVDGCGQPIDVWLCRAPSP